MNKILIILIIPTFFFSCNNSNPNIDSKGADELKSHEVESIINKNEFNFNDVVYVPIYSDLYIDNQNQKNLLAATLSIRNTSYDDSLFVSKIDYYNTDGQLVKKFLEKSISLSPMASLNYVIEKDDDTGGNGANFIVEMSSKNNNVSPLIQAVMVGQNGNKAFSFVTDGYSIKD